MYNYPYEGYDRPLYAGSKEGAEKCVMKKLKKELPNEVFKDYDEYHKKFKNNSGYEIFELEVGE